MKKRFVILTDTSTKEQEEAIRLYMADWGWWHWLPNVLLVSDPDGVLTAKKIREDLQRVVPYKSTLVLEFLDTEDTWAGFGSDAMFDWIKKYWGRNP